MAYCTSSNIIFKEFESQLGWDHISNVLLSSNGSKIAAEVHILTTDLSLIIFRQ
jgi:hypothetical protein